MKIVFVASIIRNRLCIIYVFCYFFQKSLFTENNFLVAAINLATRGPLCNCLVPFKTFLDFWAHFLKNVYQVSHLWTLLLMGVHRSSRKGKSLFLEMLPIQIKGRKVETKFFRLCLILLSETMFGSKVPNSGFQ